MNLDGYRHPVIERGDLDADTMSAHNRTVGFQVNHAGHRYYGGTRRGVELWEDVFGQRVDGPGVQSVEGYLARRDADRARIAPYYESPRPAVPAWW